MKQKQNIFISFWLILTINTLSVYKVMGLATPAFISSAIIMLSAAIWEKVHQNRRITHYSAWKQLSIIFALLFLFVQSAVFSSISNITHRLRGGTCSTVVSILLLWSLCSAFSQSIHLKEWIVNKVKQNKVFVVILIISALLRVIQFNGVPIFDGEQYFHALAEGCAKFDFTISQFLDSFMLMSHPAVGYAAILGIGEYICPGAFWGLHTVNLILTLFVIVFLYDLLLQFNQGISRTIAALAVGIISCMPMFLGTFSYIHLDYGIAVFFVFTVYLFSKREHILGVFFSLVLLCTKEVGIILYTGFFVGILLFRFINIKEKKISSRIIALWHQKEIWVMSIPLFLALFWVLLTVSGTIPFWNPTLHNTEKSSVTVLFNVGDSVKNVFGINYSYIRYRLLQIFIFDGHWLFLIFGCLAVTKLRFRKHVNAKNGLLHNQYGFCLFVSGIFMLLFSLVYITYELMRYNIVLELWLAVVLISFFLQIQTPNIYNIIAVILLWFSCVLQAFFSLDPITKAMSLSLNTEAMPIGCLAENTSWKGDTLVYNYHYNFINKFIDSVLAQSDYMGQSILINEQQQTLWPSGRYNTFIWDYSQKRRIYIGCPNANTVNINPIYYSEFNDLPSKKLPKDALLIFLPIYDMNMKAELKKVRQEYKVSKVKEINLDPWGKGYYYQLHLK